MIDNSSPTWGAKPKLIRTNHNNKWCVWSKVEPLIFSAAFIILYLYIPNSEYLVLIYKNHQ